MRKLLLFTVLLLGVAAPAQAAPFTASVADAGHPFARSSALCPCIVQFTRQYTHNFYDVRARVTDAMRRRGVLAGWRWRFDRGVYDYEKGGYGGKKGWCKRNLRACRAVIACEAAAAGYVLNAPKVISRRELAKGAAKNCALAASVALFTP
jgi:hypothetical protein